jgi:hypothetical protein
MLVSSHNQVAGYDVIDPVLNFSDHLPLFASFVSHNYIATDTPKTRSVTTTPVRIYYHFTNLLDVTQSLS